MGMQTEIQRIKRLVFGYTAMACAIIGTVFLCFLTILAMIKITEWVM